MVPGCHFLQNLKNVLPALWVGVLHYALDRLLRQMKEAYGRCRKCGPGGVCQ